MFDYTDFYITNSTEPTFNQYKVVEDDIINVILQKYKLVLFTNKGDVMGDPNFGADLEYLLFQTKVSNDYVKNSIITQINTYIPELISMNYYIDVVFTQDPYNYYDTMYIFFKLSDYEVYAQFGNSIN
jgi:hypothetical protein